MLAKFVVAFRHAVGDANLEGQRLGQAVYVSHPKTSLTRALPRQLYPGNIPLSQRQ